MGLSPGSNPLRLAKVQIGMGGMSSERVKASAEGPREHRPGDCLLSILAGFLVLEGLRNTRSKAMLIIATLRELLAKVSRT